MCGGYIWFVAFGLFLLVAVLVGAVEVAPVTP